MSLNLIIDTDAGVDDAQALLLAMAAPDVSIAAITCVTGNVDVDRVVANVALTAQIMNCPAPIYRGCARPLLSTWEAEDPIVHGSDGLGDWQQRPAVTRTAETEHAVAALIRLAHERPGEYTLVTLGPLTNLALAVTLSPGLLGKFKQIVMMGGAYAASGNTANVTAEWNLFCDPEAGQIVFDQHPADAPPIVLVTWETTIFNTLPWPIYTELTTGSGVRAQFLKGITDSTKNFGDGIPGLDGYLIPDPLAMACAIDPALIAESSLFTLGVETAGRHGRGQTVVDYMRRWQRPANARVVSKVDLNGVAALYRQAVRG